MRAELVVASPLDAFIREILKGYENVDVVMTNIAGRTYVTAKELGFSLVSEDSELIACVQVHGGRADYEPRFLILPSDLSMSDARVEVHEKIGPPYQVGGGGINPLTGNTIPVWEAFLIGKYRCHIEYIPSERGIALVSLDLARH